MSTIDIKQMFAKKFSTSKETIDESYKIVQIKVIFLWVPSYVEIEGRTASKREKKYLCPQN